MTKGKISPNISDEQLLSEIKKLLFYIPSTRQLQYIFTNKIVELSHIRIKSRQLFSWKVVYLFEFGIYPKSDEQYNELTNPVYPIKNLFKPTKEYLIKHFLYDNGFLIAKANNKIIGSLDIQGYSRTSIENKACKVHQLIWIYFNGEIPKGKVIDHINAIKDDNRIENMRLSTTYENSQNQTKAQKRSKTGLIGAFLKKSNRINYYLSAIKVNGKNLKLGRFDTAEEAHQAYLTAKRIHHPFCTI